MRRFGGTAAVIVAAAATLLPNLATPALADEGLRWETTATYTFDSPAGVVRAQIEADLRNELQNERDGNVIRKPYFTGVTIPIANDAANVVATGDGTPLAVSLGPSDSGEYQFAEIDFADNLFSGEGVHLVVTYDLVGAPPRSEGPERINSAYASFFAYGVGDPGLTTVRVIIPESFEFESFGDGAVETVESGFRVLTATEIEDPGSWAMLVSARNDEALVATTGSAGEVTFDVRAWPNDPEWATFASSTITSGLPVMTDLIGLPWPIDHPLEVRETITPYLYGYAGWFDGATGDIEVGEDLDPEVMLHELSHAWFNSDLFADRWVSEGLAQAYANRVLAATGGTPGEPQPIDVTALGWVPLANWGDVDLATDEVDDAREEYGYNTSWYVIDALVDEIGEEKMAAIFSAAELNQNAYPGDVETSGPTLDAENWHTLLDLAEEVGGSIAFEPLLRSYVAEPGEIPLLDERLTARTAFDALEAAGGSWRVPSGIRRSMGEWSFAEATEEMAAATGVLASRDDVARKAADLELEPPGGLESSYETAGWRNETLEALAEVSADLDEQHLALADLFEIDGALEDAEAQLAEMDLEADLDPYAEPARRAFEAGDLAEVTGLVDEGATEVAEWLTAAELLDTTAANADAPRSFFEDVGLRGTDVDGMLDDARDAFTGGDRERATELAEDVQRTLDDAESTGKRRVIIGATIVLLLVVLVLLLVVLLRRRKRRRVVETPSWSPPSAGAEQPVGVVVGGVEQLDAELLEGHVAGRAEAGERREEGESPPLAGVEDERHE
jgi:hypothetical protein